MKKVLIISMAFPPVPMVGAIRMAKFCKYLPELNWQPSVLTQKVKDFYEGQDWSPLEDITHHIQVIRTPNFQPFYWWDHRTSNRKGVKKASLSKVVTKTAPTEIGSNGVVRGAFKLLRQVLTVPDDRLAWFPQAFLPAMTHTLKEGIDVIFSSSPSVTNHILGFFLSVLTGRPHVVDFRDLWTLNEVYSSRQLPLILKQYDRLLEKIILKHSKRIIVVNQTLRSQLVGLYPDICKDKIEVIYNGFDEDDIKVVEFSDKEKDYFKIVYAGSIYVHRSPDFFLEAMAKWVQKNDRVREKVRLNFYGSKNPDYIQKIGELGLEGIVNFHGRVERKEILQILFKADLLLLIHGFDKLTASSTSTKLFEYLATGKPILGLMPESEAADILKRESKNIVVSSPDIDQVVDYLQNRFSEWEKQTEPINYKINIPTEFSRKYQSQKLALSLNSVLMGRN